MAEQTHYTHWHCPNCNGDMELWEDPDGVCIFCGYQCELVGD